MSDPRKIARRLEEAGRPVFPGWYFRDCPVQFFDPNERKRNEYFDLAMSKDFRFAYQNECRILCSQSGAAPVDGFQFVDRAPAQDIMTMDPDDGGGIHLQAEFAVVFRFLLTGVRHHQTATCRTPTNRYKKSIEG